MQSITNIVGVLLIIGGIIILGYRGYSYTTEEKIAQIGSLQVTAEHDKHVYIPPVIGGVMVIAGLALVFIGRTKK
jgi:hypothetical protein